MKYFTIFFLLFMCSLHAISQNVVSGKVTDEFGVSLAQVSVTDKGTLNTVKTDDNGNYSITVSSEDSILQFNLSQFKSKEVVVGLQTLLNIILDRIVTLNEVVLVGSRTTPRVNTSGALPIDSFSSAELTNTGQISTEQALQNIVPSFNTTTVPVSDASSLLDAYEIRNLGPSRTLVLINGKRKNLSALLYTYGFSGRGETGADISGIPIDAIKRIEVLRDGASAQYGSDAISGVVNIVLKDSPNDGGVILRSGISSKGDGDYFGVAFNHGDSFLKDKGFINYTIDFAKVNRANRPGMVNAAGEITDFTNGKVEEIAIVNEFLERNPDAKNVNGSPNNAVGKFLINAKIDVSDHSKLYFNTSYAFKNINSNANYRTPYWRTIKDFPYLSDFFPASGARDNYDGYLPIFDGVLNDYHGTIGVTSKKNGWSYDLSYTTGGNLQKYTVSNSHNRNFVYSPSTWIDTNNNGTIDDGELTHGVGLYRENSPVRFDSGGANFFHNVGNLDVTKSLSDNVNVAFGFEFRNENFEIIPGELASYDGGGADSYAGSRPENAGKFNRYNFGGYADLSYDVSESFLINGAIRAETYSDFGEDLVWKISSRYKINDILTVRGSVSSGFRAPTLHQIYSQKLQYTFIAGQGIQETGLINNVSSQAKALGVPKLNSEKSFNTTLGIGAKVSNNVSAAIDYYNIAINDRIILSTDIGGSQIDNNGNNIGTTPLDAILRNNNLNGVSFFMNGLDTRTSGLDVVFNYKNIGIGKGVLDLNLSGNYTIDNKRVGAVKNPDIIESGGQSILNESIETSIFTSRPKTKWILNANYKLSKFNFSLENIYFGRAIFKDPGLNTNLRTEFIPKVLTNLGVSCNLSDKLKFILTINNICNVLPEWKFKAENAEGQRIINDTSLNAVGITPLQVQSNLITFNQRYSQTTYFGYHFNQFGTMFNMSLKYNL